MSTGRCAGLVGRDWFPVAGGGERAVHTPACAVPPSPRGSSRDGGVWKGGGGFPVPPASPFPPCLPSRVRPSRARPRPGRSRGEVVSRVVRAACSRARAVVASSPPDHGSVSTAGGLAGALLPPSTGLRRVRDSRGWPRSRGRTLFLGERRSAASGASSDVGTRSAAAAASRAAAGGSVRGESRPARWTGERLSGCRLSDGSVGLLAEGASAGGPSGPAVLWEGVRRGRLPGLPRWAPGRRVEPARVPRCGGGGSGRCLFPPRSPEARPPSLGGLSPPLSPSRGVKVARRPPPLLLRLSA